MRQRDGPFTSTVSRALENRTAGKGLASQRKNYQMLLCRAKKICQINISTEQMGDACPAGVDNLQELNQCVAQWVERLTGCQRVMGSIPVSDSECLSK